MTVATIFIVAIVRGKFGTSGMPILRISNVPGAYIGNETIGDRIGRDASDCSINESIEIRFYEGLSNQCGDDLRAINGFPIVADTGSAASKINSKCRITRRDQAPTINKNLRTDLFSHDFTIQRNRTRLRRRNTIFKSQVGGMLGGVSESAPPQDGAVFDDIVKPGLTDLRRGEIKRVVVIR